MSTVRSKKEDQSKPLADWLLDELLLKPRSPPRCSLSATPPTPHNNLTYKFFFLALLPIGPRGQTHLTCNWILTQSDSVIIRRGGGWGGALSTASGPWCGCVWTSCRAPGSWWWSPPAWRRRRPRASEAPPSSSSRHPWAVASPPSRPPLCRC